MVENDSDIKNSQIDIKAIAKKVNRTSFLLNANITMGTDLPPDTAVSKYLIYI